MKNYLSIFFLALTLIVVQACGTKTEEKTEVNSEEAVIAGDTTTNMQVVLTAADKKIMLEKERAERLEIRRLAFEKLVVEKPTYKDADGEVIYNKAEVDPSFAGGNKAMVDYLRDNIKYPEAAQAKEIEGTVFVDFVITKNGDVRGVEVTEATSEEVDQSFRDEALRVVTAMPKWAPGRQHGKAVATRFSVPITFEMD